MRHMKKAVFATVIISFFYGFDIVEGKGLPKIDKLLPPQTVLLLKTDNFQQLTSRFEKTNIYKLYKDPVMTNFLDDAKSKWQGKIAEMGNNNEIFKTVLEADVRPQGKVAFALTMNNMTEKQVPFLLIAEWGDNVTKAKEVIEKMVEKAVEDGANRKTEDYRGVSIVIIIKEVPPKKAPFSGQTNMPVEPEPIKTYYCFVDDCLIGAFNVDTLKFVIAQIKGAGSPTLADEANYTTTMKTVGPYHDVDLFVNIKHIIKTVLAEDTKGVARSAITNLGFDNVASFGCAVGIAREPRSSFTAKAFLKIDGAKKGVCKMLDMESAPIKAPGFIPDSTYSLAFLNLNIQKAYTELANILASFSPQAGALFYVPLIPATPEGEPGLQLKSGIIDHLGSQIIVAQYSNKPFTETQTPSETALALSVNNRTALENSMAALHSKLIAPNNPDARRQLLGHTIYIISLQGIPFFGGGMSPMQDTPSASNPQIPALAFTVTDTHLILGTEPIVEKAIRTLTSKQASSVGSAEWFTKAKASIPSVVGLACASNNIDSAEVSWWIFKQGAKSQGPLAQHFGPGGLGQLFNPQLLPDFKTVKKYFGVHSLYGVSRQDGFFYEFRDTDF